MNDTAPPTVPNASCNLFRYEPSFRGLMLRQWEADAAEFGPDVATVAWIGPEPTAEDPQTEDFEIAVQARDAALRRLIDSYNAPLLVELAGWLHSSQEQALAFAISYAHTQGLKYFESLAAQESTGETEAARNPGDTVEGQVPATPASNSSVQ